MNLQNNNQQNTYQNLQNQNQNQNQNNQLQNNQYLNYQNQNLMNQNLPNQAQLQNEASLAAQGYNPQQDLELAAELNQKTPGEIQRILNSQKMANIEFGYIPDAGLMQMNNLNNNNNMNNRNNQDNLNEVNNALNLGQR
ncbi:MAG TPA: hypothetical protein VEC37_15805 [Bacillota bacterium]|nr:hypothetical protein [Bacillota bacterium]